LSKKKKIQNLHVAKVDIDASPFLRYRHKIGSLPAIKLFRDGANYSLPQPREFRTPKQYIKYARKTFMKEQKQEDIRQKELAKRETERIMDVDLTSKVVRLVSKTFVSLVGTGNWLIDFYGAKCERCKKLDHKWEKVAHYVFRRKLNFQVARFDCTQGGGTDISKSFDASPWPAIFRVKDRVAYSHPDSKNFEAWDIEDYIEWGEQGYLEDYSQKTTPDIFTKDDKRAARKAKYGKRKKKKVIKGLDDPPKEQEEPNETEQKVEELEQKKQEEIIHPEL